MSNPHRKSATVTTAADGTATAYIPVVSGRLSQIRYVKDDYAAGVDFTITNETTGETLWTEADVNASVTVAPRQPTHGTDGAAALYAAAGTAVNDQIVLVNDRIKIAIAQGGDSKSGTFHFTLE
ncbi:MAG: hypothetical protein HQL70_09690 [Magnetococcales bacterium]|nr:hypothetical protein [Magnetococcales bacterium]